MELAAIMGLGNDDPSDAYRAYDRFSAAIELALDPHTALSEAVKEFMEGRALLSKTIREHRGRKSVWDEPLTLTAEAIHRASAKSREAQEVIRNLRAQGISGMGQPGAVPRLSRRQLETFRDHVLKNIRKHCQELYKQGAPLEACRSAAVIAAAEIADVLKEMYGVEINGLGAFPRHSIPQDELVVELLITFASQTFREGNDEGLEMMREAKTKADELVAQAQTPAEMLRARKLQRAAAVGHGAMQYSLYKEEHGVTPPASWIEERVSRIKRGLGRLGAEIPAVWLPRTPLAWHETRTGVHAAVAASKGDLDTAKRLIRKSVTEAFARARKAQTPKHQALEMQTAYEAFQFFNRLHEDPQAAVVYAQEILRRTSPPLPA